VEPRPVLFRVPEVILKLLVEPAFSAGVKGHRETDRHLRADTRTPVKNARQRLPTHAERPRGVRDGQVQGFQAQLPEHLTGCGGSCIFMVTSMAIFVIYAIYVLPAQVNVTRQLPLTFTAHVPLREPRSSWRSKPGKLISRARVEAFKGPRMRRSRSACCA